MNLCLPRSQRYKKAKQQISISTNLTSYQKLNSILKDINWLVREVHKVCTRTRSVKGERACRDFLSLLTVQIPYSGSKMPANKCSTDLVHASHVLALIRTV